MKKLIFILLLLFAGNIVSLAQNAELDSLINIENNYQTDDSIHLILLIKISSLSHSVNLEVSIEYCNRSIALANKLGDLKRIADIHKILGAVYCDMGSFDIAKEEFYSALEGYQACNNMPGMASIFNDLGLFNQFAYDDLETAEAYLLKAAAIYDSLGLGIGLAKANQNLGSIYGQKGDYQKAQLYMLKGAKYCEENIDKYGIVLCNTYILIGNLYLYTNDLDKAREYYLKSDIIADTKGYMIQSALAKSNLGIVYLEMYFKNLSDDIDLTMKYLMESFVMLKELNDNSAIPNVILTIVKGLIYIDDSTFNRLYQAKVFDSINTDIANQYELAAFCLNKTLTGEYNIVDLSAKAAAYNLMGDNYLKLKNYEQSVYWNRKALRLADSIQDPIFKRDALESMAVIFESTGKYDSAYIYYKDYISLRDTIENKEKQDQLARKFAEYEYSIKEKDILHQKELSDIAAANANTKLEQQLLLARTREQEMLLKDKALEIGRKDKEMQHLAYLKKMAELDVVKLDKQDKEKQLSLTKQNLTLQDLKLGKRELERNLLIVGVALSLLSIFLIFRNYRNQRKAALKQKELNSNIRWANEELNHKNTKLAETLEDLKETQAQLVATEKQKETEVIRRRISQDIHDDISSGLTRIAWLSELAREKAKNGSPADAESALEKILASSRETVDRLGEIIWAINPDRDNLEGFFAYLRSYILRFFEDTRFDVTLDFPEQKPDLKFNPDLKRTLFLVVKEALHNIAKHSEAKNIGVAFHCPDHRYSITITDDGKGFDPVVMEQKSNGLRNMRKRMESIGGQIEIESQPQQGTVVNLEGEVYS